MPFDPCDPCCDPEASSRGVDIYRASVLRILCGILSVNGGNTDTLVNQFTVITTNTETTILDAEADTYHDIRLISLANTSATPIVVTIRDGTGGAVKAVKSVAAGATETLSYSPPLPAAAVNTPWTAQSSAAVTSLNVTVSGVKRS